MSYKIKTRKAAKKRVKQISSGFLRKKAYKAHLLRKKGSSQLRRLSAASCIHKTDLSKFFIMIPY
jgi:large subunit ribosomal protein L35